MLVESPLPAWSDKPKGMSDMRRLARDVVDKVPLVQAAILFGSRARGTASSDSDWDVALVIPNRYRKRVLRDLPRVPTVNYVSLSPKRLRERHNQIGTLERSISIEGLSLAGEWTLSQSQKQPAVSCAVLANGLNAAAVRIDTFINQVMLANLSQIWLMENTLCDTSQDAAERTARSALIHLGIHPPPTHNMMAFADELRISHPGHAWVERIESFNGYSSERHVADYDAQIMETVEESLTRTCRVIEFHKELLETIAIERPQILDHLLRLSKYIAVAVTLHGKSDAWSNLPDDLKHQLLQWKHQANELLKSDFAGNSKPSRKE